MLHGVACSSIA